MPRNDLWSAPVIGVERARGRAALRLGINGIGMFVSNGELWSKEKRSLVVREGWEEGVQKRKSAISFEKREEGIKLTGRTSTT